MERVYGDAAKSGAVADVLVALESLARRGRLEDCHLQAHRLAHAVFAEVGDVERAFLLGGPQCRMGYLHGAVEATGADAHGAPTVPRCVRFVRALERLACAHGFGHALMLRNRHDVRRSVAGCRNARAIDARACTLGVMMENSLRFAGRRDYAAASARGCAPAAKSPELSRLCFDNIGIVAALSLGHDALRSNAVCDELLRARERRACRDGVAGEIAEARRSA